MKIWMLIVAAPFAAYTVYLIGSGKVEDGLEYRDALVSCSSAARDAGVPFNDVSSTCNCVERSERRWQSANPGAEMSGARAEELRNSCFAAKIPGSGAAQRGGALDMQEREEGNDWAAKPGEYEFESDWN